MTSVLADVKAYLLGDSSKPSDQILEDKYNKFLKCLDFEQRLRASSITTIPTITWFRGDKTKASKFLRGRMEKIVKANPWLAGSIVDRNRLPHVAFQDGPDFDPSKAVDTMLFDNEPEIDIDLDMKIEHLSDELVKHPSYIVRSRHSEPIWRAVVLQPKENKDIFAVVMTMAHMAADGHSYYRIYQMFVDPDIPIEALDPKRDVDEVQIRQDIFGNRHIQLEQDLGTIWHFIAFKLFRTFRLNPQQYMVDLDKIKEMKKRHNPDEAGVPFVSTNDIVASWYFKSSGAPNGRMAINLRDRVPDETLNDQMSANYQGTIFLQSPKETNTPSDIRKVIRNLKRPEEDLPSGWQTLFGGKHALFSNWLSLSGLGKLEPPGCTEIKHLPLAVNRAGIPSGGIGIFHRYAQGKASLRVASYEEDCHLFDTPEFASKLDD